jgi:hypothetical protein
MMPEEDSFSRNFPTKTFIIIILKVNTYILV